MLFLTALQFSNYSQLPHSSKEWKDISSNFSELSSSSASTGTECSAGENWTQDNLQFNQGLNLLHFVKKSCFILLD